VFQKFAWGGAVPYPPLTPPPPVCIYVWLCQSYSRFSSAIDRFCKNLLKLWKINNWNTFIAQLFFSRLFILCVFLKGNTRSFIQDICFVFHKVSKNDKKYNSRNNLVQVTYCMLFTSTVSFLLVPSNNKVKIQEEKQFSCYLFSRLFHNDVITTSLFAVWNSNNTNSQVIKRKFIIMLSCPLFYLKLYLFK
jgi:hypothetical protein